MINSVRKIDYINFSADMAIERGRKYFTLQKDAYLKLTREGLEMIEIAPGLDPERDILSKMPFRSQGFSPILKNMPDICFEL